MDCTHAFDVMLGCAHDSLGRKVSALQQQYRPSFAAACYQFGVAVANCAVFTLMVAYTVSHLGTQRVVSHLACSACDVCQSERKAWAHLKHLNVHLPE